MLLAQGRWRELLARYGLLLALVVMVIVLASISDRFLTTSNIINVLRQISVNAIIAFGMTVVIIGAGIDLSVGSLLALVGVIAALLATSAGLPVWLVLILAVLIGLGLGTINGGFVGYAGVAPFIVTLAGLTIFRGATLVATDGRPVSGLPPVFAVFGRGAAGRTFGIPHSFVLTLLIVGLAWWFLRHFRSGRHLYAVGGNPVAALRAGVKVSALAVASYVTIGALAGLASAFVIASGTSTLEQSVGIGMELLVIAAVVIGGTSVLGGRGSVLGTLLGAVLVQTVRSGVTQIGWPSQSSDLFVGLAIILAVGVDIVRERRARKES